MCGIAGIVERGGIDESASFALRDMLRLLEHRGPDDSGQHVGVDVALGHRRLSIVNLATGRQPIPNESESVWTIANGEIYNYIELTAQFAARGHVFRTSSDAECLVHLYEEHGDSLVEHINGMFGFAIWDNNRRRCLLARDRLGVKPVYYCIEGKRLVFASELKALLRALDARPQVDPTALLDYLTYGYIPSPKSIYMGVHKLPPGHLLAFEDGRAIVRRYWDLAYTGLESGTDEAIAERLWWHLKAATRPRLIADVPVAAFLSGGVDSSSIAAAMSQVGTDPIVTVTCGFDEHGFDERGDARETAAFLGTQHHEQLVGPDALDVVDRLVWHCDEPFADASAVPTYYLSRYARSCAKVVLSGDGGDEVLAGYRRYRFDRFEESLRQWLPGSVRRGFLGPLASVYPRREWIPRSLRASSTLRNLSEDAATAHGLSIANMLPQEARALLRPEVRAAVAEYNPLQAALDAYERCSAPDHLSKCQYVDIRLGLGDGILTKVDRMSMAHGLEVRSPLLDYRFVEWAWRIPPERRMRGKHGKIPLRRAVAGVLTPRIAERTKAGFEVPVDAWFRGPLAGRLEDSLLRQTAACHAWLSPSAIGRLLNQHRSGRVNCGPTLWKLMVFETWCGLIHADQSDALTPAETSVCTL